MVNGKDINPLDININIGRPLSNETAYILDSHLSHSQSGAMGELYIGEQRVARGYLNNEELTKDRFIANPFQSEERNYLVRTLDYIRQEI